MRGSSAFLIDTSVGIGAVAAWFSGMGMTPDGAAELDELPACLGRDGEIQWLAGAAAGVGAHARGLMLSGIGVRDEVDKLQEQRRCRWECQAIRILAERAGHRCDARVGPADDGVFASYAGKTAVV